MNWTVEFIDDYIKVSILVPRHDSQGRELCAVERGCEALTPEAEGHLAAEFIASKAGGVTGPVMEAVANYLAEEKARAERLEKLRSKVGPWKTTHPRLEFGEKVQTVEADPLTELPVTGKVCGWPQPGGRVVNYPSSKPQSKDALVAVRDNLGEVRVYRQADLQRVVEEELAGA